ncbi:hypothetical protein G6L94_06780 [Agrobacterium rhizogenes]|uniref:Uncharacterized protein n=3 Tax=Rhizobium rhizogenes TaxID=359 RepID=B9JCC1_RHIR8|nr:MULTISPECIES: hypothetical protein [Rhizobium]ACM26042.1 hypothetical protein Arad_1661 [Rhizobium rhizogenes K84]KAA6491137.1 hypothetical protein DXT98_03030 [Agrobacterium sp. ICMP 7243]OCJ25139.1 hypothetical protein A6U88_01280 [Agrobacterium sp. B131/95]OCJ31705.1 hypothetical protein A6U89_04875 [Agrobacterium sp. B133/95]EJK85123.1 hypothetical protein PMI03_02244 [Rhizobium sp. AP16]
MRRLQYAIWAITFSATTAISSMAWADGFENIVISSAKGAETSEDTFAPDTAKIFVSADLTDDIKSGSTITVSWIAVDTAGAAPPNYKIDEVSFDIKTNENQVDSSITRPNSGWPIGTYNITFSVDGKPMETSDFSIEE